MSNTYKDKIRGKLRRKKNLNDYLYHFYSLSSEDQKRIINYNKNPSWWNHKINNVPKKRCDRILCKLIANGHNCESEDLRFSDDKKPSLWYW